MGAANDALGACAFTYYKPNCITLNIAEVANDKRKRKPIEAQ
jgi:hypothetical protein